MGSSGSLTTLTTIHVEVDDGPLEDYMAVPSTPMLVSWSVAKLLGGHINSRNCSISGETNGSITPKYMVFHRRHPPTPHTSATRAFEGGRLGFRGAKSLKHTPRRWPNTGEVGSRGSLFRWLVCWLECQHRVFIMISSTNIWTSLMFV